MRMTEGPGPPDGGGFLAFATRRPEMITERLTRRGPLCRVTHKEYNLFSLDSVLGRICSETGW